MYEYRVIEKDSKFELAEKCSEMSKAGWRVMGYGVRGTMTKEYYSAMLEKKAA